MTGKSFQATSIDRQIAEIERELIAYKATQAYGASQIQSRVATMPQPVSAVAHTAYSTTYWVMGRVTFKGVNKNKLARGALTWSPTSAIRSWYLCESSEDHSTNEMKWIVIIQSGSAFDVNFQAYMNMSGSLSYESLF